MKLFHKKLPTVPTGYEYLDLLWSQLIPDAADFVANLPRSVDPVWATVYGARFFAMDLLTLNTATAELRRTRKRSAVWRVRERRLRVMENRLQGLSLKLVSALLDQAREQYPKASPAQLLVIVRDAFRELLSAASPIAAAHTPRAPHAEVPTNGGGDR